MIKTLLLACALSLPAAARAAAPAPAKGAPASPAKPGAAAPEVNKSTASPISPSSIYTGERLRDPFLGMAAGPAAGYSASGKAFSAEDFNIHNLALRGMMKDGSSDYAIFADNVFGVTFILRKGKLYDPKNKPVRGVTGKLRLKDRWAELETADHDVQIFRLGEDEKD